jgi:transposase
MTDKTRQKESDTSLSTHPEGLSRPARQRLKWMNHFDKYRNARLTCRHFGISPDTFYLWKKRFKPDNLITLEDNYKTRKPHHLRISEHKTMQLETIKTLKNVDPRLGKIRIAKILQETGYKISGSTVGRILRDIESSPRFNRG